MSTTTTTRTDWQRALILLGLILLSWLLWQTRFVFPLKILTVLFHELSHGLVALLTGGQIERIEIGADQGGVCYYRGGWQFFVASAGYLGSLLWGGAILLLACRTRHDKIVSGTLGACLLFTAVWWVRPVFWKFPVPDFGFTFVLLTGLLLLAGAYLLSHRINEMILSWIGLCSILYVPFDIIDDTITRRGIGSDADRLGDMTWIPGIVWGIGWTVIAFAAAIYFLYLATRKSENTSATAPIVADQQPPQTPRSNQTKGIR